MKRVFCVFLVLLTILPLCFLGVSAAESEDVLTELKRYYTFNGKKFDEANFPLDESKSRNDIQIIAIKEEGVYKGNGYYYGEDYALYLYIYNPSGRYISYDLSEVSVNNTDPKDKTGVDYIGYLLRDVDKTEDNRFAKVKVHEYIYGDAAYTGGEYTTPEKRVYHFGNISSSGSAFGDFNASLDSVWAVMGLKESNTLKYVHGSTTVLELKLHGTVWIDKNPISLSYNHLYNQVSTVYFTVPDYIMQDYDRIYSIDAEFDKVLTSPIVVTNSPTLNGMSGINHLKNGDVVTTSFSEAIPVLHYGKLTYADTTVNNSKYYSVPEWVYAPTERCYDNIKDIIAQNGYGDVQLPEIRDCLAYYFYNPDIDLNNNRDFYTAVSFEKFLFYTQDLLALYGDSYMHLLSDDYQQGYKATYTAEDIDYLISYAVNHDRSWWDILLGKNKGEFIDGKYEKILAIDDPAGLAVKYANDLQGLSDDYLIAKDDAAAFLKYCENAEGTVVLLRFEQTLYSCRELYAQLDHRNAVFQQVGNGLANDLPDGEKAWLCQMTWYDNVDVTKVTFQTGNEYVAYNVNADPITVGPDIGVKDPERPQSFGDKAKKTASDWWKDLLAAIENLIGVIKFALVIVIGAVAVWLLVKVFKLLFIPLKAVGRLSDKAKQRQQRRELKRLKRDLHDRDRFE